MSNALIKFSAVVLNMSDKQINLGDSGLGFIKPSHKESMMGKRIRWGGSEGGMKGIPARVDPNGV